MAIQLYPVDCPFFRFIALLIVVPLIERKLSSLINNALLHLEEDYWVSGIMVQKEDWLTNKTLEKLTG